jgi:predicted DNA-binding transcriptional regulator AlpA
MPISEPVQRLVELLYTEAHVCTLLNTDRRGIWRAIRDAQFPTPVLLPAGKRKKRVVVWLRDDVQGWLAEHRPPRPKLQRPQ